MANNLLTSSVIAKEALAVIENNLVFAKNINRQYEPEFERDRKVGDTITVRKPARFTVRSGASVSIQDHVEESTTLQLSNLKGVDVNFSSKELALSIEDFSKQVLQPQIAALANQIDMDGLIMAYQSCPNAIGTPGTTPTTYKTYLQAAQKMNEYAAPVDEDRRLIINPAAQVEILDATKGLFQSSSQIKDQYEKGQMGTAAGFDWYMSQNVYSHTVGPLGGTPVMNGATASGATQIVTNGWTAAAASRLKKGDVITIAAVNAVNPISKASLGYLKQFVVTADVSSDGSGNATIPIYPAIVFDGTARSNVSALPLTSAAITVLGAASTVTPTNLAFHKNAFTLCSAELPLPGGVDMASRASSKKTGMSLRFVRQYQASTDLWVSRFDVLYGYAALYPEWACRIQG